MKIKVVLRYPDSFQDASSNVNYLPRSEEIREMRFLNVDLCPAKRNYFGSNHACVRKFKLMECFKLLREVVLIYTTIWKMDILLAAKAK